MKIRSRIQFSTVKATERHAELYFAINHCLMYQALFSTLNRIDFIRLIECVKQEFHTAAQCNYLNMKNGTKI